VLLPIQTTGARGGRLQGKITIKERRKIQLGRELVKKILVIIENITSQLFINAQLFKCLHSSNTLIVPL